MEDERIKTEEQARDVDMALGVAFATMGGLLTGIGREAGKEAIDIFFEEIDKHRVEVIKQAKGAVDLFPTRTEIADFDDPSKALIEEGE